MPKKIKQNPKAVEAKARKEADKSMKTAAKAKAAEDALWVDEGSTASEKRKAEKEAKRIEELQKKQKKAALQAKEDADRAKKAKPSKLTRTAILSLQEQAALDAAKQKEVEDMKRSNIVPQIEIVENVNQRAAAEHTRDLQTYKGGVVSASGVDEALKTFTPQTIGQSAEFATDNKDKHPEKRMKAAFADYEDKNLPLLKAEHPTLKHTQLKELIWKNWQKAAENPMNQSAAAKA